METTQRVVQILIVWLIPLLGALGLYLFHKSQDDYVSIPFKGKFGGGDNGSSHTSTGNQAVIRNTYLQDSSELR